MGATKTLYLNKISQPPWYGALLTGESATVCTVVSRRCTDESTWGILGQDTTSDDVGVTSIGGATGSYKGFSKQAKACRVE